MNGVIKVLRTTAHEIAHATEISFLKVRVYDDFVPEQIDFELLSFPTSKIKAWQIQNKENEMPGVMPGIKYILLFSYQRIEI